MTSRDFCYWLQGIFEVGDVKELNASQIAIVRAHLSMVFVHEIDPSMGDQKHQELLTELHNGTQSSAVSSVAKIPHTEAEAAEQFGPKPGPEYKFNLHGWYDPAKGTPRC